MTFEKPPQHSQPSQIEQNLAPNTSSDINGRQLDPYRFLVRVSNNVEGEKTRREDLLNGIMGSHAQAVLSNKQETQEGSPEIKPSFLEDQTESMFSRIDNPRIKEQLISLFEAKERYLSTQDVISPGAPVHDGFDFLLNEDGSVKRGDPVVTYDHTSYVPRTREDIEKNIDTIINTQKLSTDIDFTNNESGSNAEYETGKVTIVLHPETAVSLDGNTEVSLKDIPKDKRTALLSAVEAHEKGHMIRQFKDEPGTTFLADYFQKGFTLDLAKSDFLYLFNASEIAERMSQLKNYFGMQGDEEFTKEHLQYAKENYSIDTNLNNQMTQFFGAITPESEKDFLRIINNSGI